MRELNLDTPPRPDDAADALAVALTGWFQRNDNAKKPGSQRLNTKGQ